MATPVTDPVATPVAGPMTTPVATPMATPVAQINSENLQNIIKIISPTLPTMLKTDGIVSNVLEMIEQQD